jgi:hypothetical protein
MKISKPAKGIKGFIIRTFDDPKDWFFRVYNEDHSFTDYRIEHCDLEVTIESEDANFYELPNQENILDYSEQVLNGRSLY